MERLRILLINPPRLLHAGYLPYACPPLGLAYLAGVLEKTFDVKILDCMVEGITHKSYVSRELTRWGVDMDELALRIPRWEPDVVGISCSFSSQEDVVFDVARVYKEHARIRERNIIIVAGGAHASAVPWEIMGNKDIDFVVSGEGEVPLYQLCKALQAGADVGGIEGLAYRDQRGNIMVNPRESYIKDLDEIPFPARHLLLMDKYSQSPTYFQPRAKPYTNMLLGRGCDSRCIFCSVPGCFGPVYRPRSAESVLDEMKMLLERYNIKEIYFEDDHFLRDLTRAEEICRGIIESKMDFAWSCQSGIVAHGYTGKLFELMKKSGCYRVTLNIESGCDRVLGDVIGSPHDLNILTNLIPALQACDIEVAANFHIGFPRETREEIMETFDFIARFNFAGFNVYFALPFPGTPFYEECIREDLFARLTKFKDYLLENTFLKTDHFDPRGLIKIHESGMKKIWKKQAVKRPEVLIESIGGVFDQVIHPFTSREKRKRDR